MLPYRADRIAPLVQELDQWRSLLDQRGVLPRTWLGRLRRDLESEAVAASTSMEGIPVTVEEVRHILVGDRPAAVSDQDVELVRGYRDAMGLVLRRADDPGFRWSAEVLLSIHDRVLAGRFDLGAGRFRTGPTLLADRGTGKAVFHPPTPSQVAALAGRLCRSAEREPRHPAELAAWIHVAIAAIHPFRDGNGRTARVAASLAMLRGGFKLPELTSLEEWWGRHVSDYYESFRCLGARFEQGADVTPFMVEHLRAQVQQVRALDLREQVQREILEGHRGDPGADRAARATGERRLGRFFRSGGDVPILPVADRRQPGHCGLGFDERRGGRTAASHGRRPQSDLSDGQPAHAGDRPHPRYWRGRAGRGGSFPHHRHARRAGGVGRPARRSAGAADRHLTLSSGVRERGAGRPHSSEASARWMSRS